VGGFQLIVKTYELNCSNALNVLPGRSVHFAMQLPLRKLSRSSNAKFSWQLDTGDGPFLGSGVLVFAAQ
jgi:hypothetical protein